MQAINRNRIIAFAFGIYGILSLLLLGAFNFFETNIVITIIAHFVGLIGFEWLFLELSKKGRTNKKILVIKTISFFLSGFITAMIGFLFLSLNTDMLLAYFSSFVIIPILPASLLMMYELFMPIDRLLTMSIDHSNDNSAEQKSDKTLSIKNETGKVILKTSVSSIICFESNDNYVITYYLGKDASVKKSMDRLSLKNIEEILKEESIAFERVHKSFIVNPDFVDSVSGRSQAYKLKITSLNKEIPVSRSYDISLFKG
jgi:hypothetical protein